jgi:hypothetical protein
MTTYTLAYTFWRDTNFTSERLYDEEKRKISEMKTEAQQRVLKKQQRALAKKLKEDERIAKENEDNEDVEMGAHGAL